MAGNSPSATPPKPIKVRSAAKSTNRVKAAKPKVSASTSSDSSAVAAPSKPKRRVKVETVTRVYWAVFNPELKRVAVFEFNQKEEADKRAAKLTQSSGGPHFVHKIKAAVPVTS